MMSLELSGSAGAGRYKIIRMGKWENGRIGISPGGATHFTNVV
jgi:hypothetical protein